MNISEPLEISAREKKRERKETLSKAGMKEIVSIQTPHTLKA